MKKLLSLLLALVMCLSLFPVSVLADDTEVTDEPVIELPADESEETPELSDPDVEPEIEETEPADESEPEAELPEDGESEEEFPAEPEEEDLEDSLKKDDDNVLVAQNFPDPYLFSALTDIFGDTLPYSDAKNVTDLNLDDRCISDITGLSTCFTGLTKLELRNNLIETLDLARFESLAELYCSDCRRLETIVFVHGNKTNTSLQKIEMKNTCVSSLDVSPLANLLKLDCSDCACLTDIVFTGKGGNSAAALTELILNNTCISSLDLSSLGSLAKLSCNDCNLLTELNCSSDTLMTLLACSCCLQSVNLNGCTSLQSLHLNENNLTYVDLSSLTALTDIELDEQYPMKNATAWGTDSYLYIDLVADGLAPAGAAVSSTDASYSNGEGVLLLADYYLEDPNLKYTVACPLPGGASAEMSCNVGLNCPLTDMFTVPDYIVISKTNTDGVSVKLTAADGTVLDKEALSDIGINIYLYTDDIDILCISDEDRNLILPVDTGIGYLTCHVCLGSDTAIFQTAGIRVDIVEENLSTPADDEVCAKGVKAVSLLQNKVTVELYKTDYSILDVVLDMEQNMLSLAVRPEDELPNVQPNGYAIESAEFTGAAGNWFKLYPSGDRHLTIVPVYEKIEAVYRGTERAPASFTTQVKVTLADGGEPFTTGTLKISLKKTLPKVTVKPVTVSSWPGFAIGANSADINYKVKGADTVNSFAVVNPPKWVIVDEIHSVVTYKGKDFEKVYATVTAEADVDGYAVKPECTFKIYAKPIAPKFKCSAKSVTLLADERDHATVRLSVTVNKNEDMLDYVNDFMPLRITEVVNGSVVTYIPQTDFSPGEVLRVSLDYDELSIRPVNPDGRSHSYKLYYRFAGAERSLTVKVSASSATPSIVLKPIKKAGSIDLRVPYSIASFSMTGVNCGVSSLTVPQPEDYTVKITAPDKTTDVTGKFAVIFNHKDVTVALINSSGLETGKYTFEIDVRVGTDEDSNPVYAHGKIVFAVKRSKEPAPSVKFSSKGKLNVYSPGAMEIKVTAVNTSFNADSIHIYKDKECSIEVTDSFIVNGIHPGGKSGDKNIYMAWIETGEDTLPGTYYYRAELRNPDTDAVENKYSPVKFSVRAVLPKLLKSANELVLTTRDCYTGASFTVRPKTETNRIVYDVQVDSVNSELFDIVHTPYDDGSAVIDVFWKNELIRLKPGTVKTVKLRVFYGAPDVSKPVTVTVKVRIR